MVGLLAVLWPAPAHAACAGSSPSRTATTWADLSNCASVAANGDTITVASGTISGNSAITFNVAVTIIGGGCTLDGSGIPNSTPSCGTNVTDDVASGSLIVLNCVANLVSRVSGFRFAQGTRTYGAQPIIGTNCLNTDNRRVRVDANYFDRVQAWAMNPITTLGTFDHNYVRYNVPAGFGYIKGSNWNGTQGAAQYGDGAWAAACNFGSGDFFFIETNTFQFDGPGVTNMVDAQAGGRYVFRYNTMTGSPHSPASHGLEASRERSGSCFEIYNNTFSGDGSNGTLAYFRGGTGVIHDNTASGYTTSAAFNLLHNRSVDILAAPFGASDGRNVWDVNNAGNPFESGLSVSSANNAANTVTFAGTPFSGKNYAGYTVRKTSGKSCGGSGNASVSVSGGVLTVTCNSHGFSVNDVVSIWNATEYQCNAIYTVQTAATNTFTVNNGFAATCTGGAIKTDLGSFFSEIVSNTNSVITYYASIYGDAQELQFNASDTIEINKVDAGMDMPGRTGGTTLGNVSSPSVPAGWNDQTTDPWYEWNNTREAGANVNFSNGKSGGVFNVLVSGTHYKNDTQRPGYAAYTYPHPLVTCGAVTCGQTQGGVPVYRYRSPGEDE